MSHNRANDVCIAIIDDNPGAVELMASALSGDDVDIISSTDPEQGLDFVFSRHPQIVITDLVLCPRNTCTKASNLSQNRIRGRCPRKGPARTVIVPHERVNFVDQVVNTAERAAPNGSLADKCKPALYLVQPGRVSWRVVNVITGTSCQPGAHLRMFVRGVVIHN